MSYRSFRTVCAAMRIMQSGGEHLIALSEAEAATLVDASALLVLASHSVDGAALPPGMASLLAQLFEGLRQPAAVPLTDHGR